MDVHYNVSALSGLSGNSVQLPLSVLFVCTGNSCRSILAEGLLTHHGGSRVQAYSAGSNPAGFVHPLTLETLANRGIELPDARSKSWDEFEGQALDCVLTVCDAAAGEACPLFSGPALRAHWGVPDPAGFEGDEPTRHAYFEEVCDRLETAVRALLALPLEQLDEAELQRQLDTITIA